MKFVLVLSLVTLSGLANAAPSKPCPEMMDQLRGNKKIQKITINKDGYTLAKDALSHYRGYDLAGFGSHPYIGFLGTYANDAKKLTGYKIEITDGGDESTVSYYLNAKGKLVYAKYHNQSPLSFWFCGQKTALEQ